MKSWSLTGCACFLRRRRACNSSAASGRFCGKPPRLPVAQLAREPLQDLATWTSFRVVALADDEPVSAGGCTLTGEVALLWGAITLPASRGHGSYRAVLGERLRLAREHGATMVMVKGRSLRTGPTLLRAGFADFGEARCVWLPVTES